MNYLVLMAGGHGTRLWPVSREKKPKQVQPFMNNNETLLEQTFKRVKKDFPINNIFVTTTIRQYPIIKKILSKIPKENFSIEPDRRDTSAAIGLAAAVINKRDPNSVITTINTDAYVEDKKEYIKIIKLAQNLASQNEEYTILIGINPIYPETGLGYIKMKKPFGTLDGHESFYVDQFIEKPDLKTAQSYLKRWEYLWNPALFTWKTKTLLTLYKKYLPKTYNSLKKIQEFLGTKKEKRTIQKEYAKMQKISIDYAVLEKTRNLLVIPADFGWADVGHWRTIKDVLSNDKKENLIKGSHVGVESKGNLIYGFSGRLIATAGLRDMIIIDTEDCILICHKNNAQDVKKIVEQLKKKGLKKYL
jgi:mannose-1-phosphate guanylyltransferase